MAANQISTKIMFLHQNWKAGDLVDHPQGSDMDNNHYWKWLPRDFYPSTFVWGGAEGFKELLWNKGKPAQETAVLNFWVKTKDFEAGHDFHTFPGKASPAPLGRFPTPVISQHQGSFILLFPSATRAPKKPTQQQFQTKEELQFDELSLRILWKNPKDPAITSQTDTTAQQWGKKKRISVGKPSSFIATRISEMFILT